MSFVDITRLANLYQSPYDTYPDEWMIHNFLVVRLNKSDFKNNNLTSLAELKEDSAAGVILKCLGAITELKQLGTNFKRGNERDSYYCDADTPKTVQILEATVTETGELNGYFFWIFINDEAFNFGDGFKKLFTYKASKRNQGLLSREELSWKFEQYLKKAPGTFQNMELGGDGDIANPECILNPYTVLSLENALALTPATTIQEQSSAESYFNLDDDMTGESFKKNFPKPFKTFKITTPSLFNLEYACGAPLPEYLDGMIGKHRNHINSLRDECEGIRRQMADISLSREDRDVFQE